MLARGAATLAFAITFGWCALAHANGQEPKGRLSGTFGGDIEYDEVLERDGNGDGRIDQRAYYREGKMVAAAFDNDGNAKFDAWVRFDEKQRVTEEAIDRDGDGRAEEVQVLDESGRQKGKARLVESPPLVEELPIAAAEEKPKPESKAASLGSAKLPLDGRLWSALGFFAVSLIPFSMAMRRRA